MKRENILDKTSKENSEKATEQNAEYIDMLDKSMAEAEAGKFITKTIDELETYEWEKNIGKGNKNEKRVWY